MEQKLTLTVNGTKVSRSVEPRTHLIDFLRDALGLTGSHIGCEHGACGACTVRVDGNIVRGCLTLFFIGFVKKACVGDTLASVSDAYCTAPQYYNSFSAWMGILAYTGQIYCDFSGYTDMAIATARVTSS